MFFIKLRIWAWFNSTEINGSLSIHLNEAESTFITLECKTLQSFSLTEGICYFQKSLRAILPHEKLVKSGQEKRTHIHEGISIWKCLMSVGNINILSLLYFFFRVIVTLNESRILKHDLKNLRRYWQRSNVRVWDMWRELNCSRVLHFYLKQCSVYECKENKRQYFEKGERNRFIFSKRKQAE